jgi:hypothetical protein
MKKSKQTKYANYGEKNPKAKLTKYHAETIRVFFYKCNYTYKRLSEMFGVSKSTIGRVCTGESWKNS